MFRPSENQKKEKRRRKSRMKDCNEFSNNLCIKMFFRKKGKEKKNVK